MRDDEIRRLVTDANPWWRAAARGGDPVAAVEGHRLLRDRNRYDVGYRSKVLSDLADRPLGDDLLVFTGPRRVGKSVALLDLASRLCARSDLDPRQVIHLPCDGLAPRDLRRVLTLGRDLTRVVDSDGPVPRCWLLDEVSSVQDWTSILNAARDGTAFGDETVVVTGSRWLPSEDVRGNLLAGRAGASPTRRVRHLLPMTFREYLAATARHLSLPDPVHPSELQSYWVANALADLAFDVDAYDLAWQAFLTSGAFPRAVAEYERDGAVSVAFMRDLTAWLQRDVDPDGNPESIPQLLEQLALQMASPVSRRAMSDEFAATRRGVMTWLTRLTTTFAALWCHQHQNGRQVQGSQSKLYLVDPVLAWLPSVVRTGLVEPDMTVLNEAAVGVALARAIENLDEGRWVAGDTIGYVRTGSGGEVDFGPVPVLAPTGAVDSVPIECKWVDRNWRAEARTIEGRFGRGIVATKSILDTSGDVWAVPAPLIALLLG